MISYTTYVYKKDRRCKAGERLVNTYVQVVTSKPRDYSTMDIRVESFPTTKIVKNFMTGDEIAIPHDTPRCCDPSTETYWSM